MEIKSLRYTSFDRIYKAFSKAFDDYEIQLSKEELRTMLVRRGFLPELSFGAFDEKNLISFTFNGIGKYNGIKTAYDTGTGTVREYRGKGLATQIFEHSIPFLRKENITQYLLEVLQHNTKAVSVYRKLGFEVSREFNYFRNAKSEVKPVKTTTSVKAEVRTADIDICRSLSRFCDFNPSWQNSFESIARKPEDFVFLVAFAGETPAGYCIIEPASGDITQIAVCQGHRKKGIGSLLLIQALRHITYDSVKVINTDAGCEPVTSFLISSGISLKGKQYEMIRKI